MKGTICALALALLASAGFAQRPGMHGEASHFGGRGGHGGRSGGPPVIVGGAHGNSGLDRLPPGAFLPSVGPIPPFDGRASAVPNRWRSGRFYGGSGIYPYYAGDEGGYAGEGPSTTYIVTQPAAAAPAPPPPPPAPIHLVIRNYTTAPETGAGAANGHQTFTIVLKDGSTRSAQLSWVSGGVLHYLDPDGDEQTLTPERIDRRETQASNQEKNIQLLLPPGTK